MNCGVETPPQLYPWQCAPAPCGPVAGGGFTGEMRVGAGAGCTVTLGLSPPGEAHGRFPPSLGARCVESDTGVHLPLIAFGSHRVLSDVPECPAMLLAKLLGSRGCFVFDQKDQV